MSYPIPVLFMIVALPLLGAVAVARARGPVRARVIGGAVSAMVMLALALVLAGVVAIGGRVEDPALSLGPLGVRPLLGLDPLAAVLAATNAVTAFAVIVGAPRARDERPRITALLLTEALILIMLASLDLLLLALAFALLVFPARARQASRREGPDSARLYRYVFLASALPLAASLGLLLFTGPTPELLDLRTLAASAPTASPLILGLLLAAVFVRMALLPLHSWLPAMTRYGALGSTVLLVASQSGAYLFVRVGLVLLPEGGQLTNYLSVAGTVSALYAATLALAADDLRRLIGWLSVSQAGLMLVGLCSLEPDGVAGAIVYWLSYGTAVTGLALTTWAVQARTGTTRISELGGLVSQCPRLTVAFVAFSVASVGFPGSLGFVAEDLLVHGVLEVHPLLGVLMIVATALCGIALIRALFRAFLGPARVEAAADLRARELWVVAALGLIAFGLGLWPDPLIDIVGLARPCIHI